MDDIIRALNGAKARYLLIGGQAVRLYGLPRFTLDWDFFVPPRDEENFHKINEALESELDMPLLPLGPRGENFVQTYQTLYGVLQFHLIGPGFPKFEEAEKRAVILKNEFGTPVRCLAAVDLLQLKEASNRAQDQTDIEFLRAQQQANDIE